MALWQDGSASGTEGTDTRSHAERLPMEAVTWLAGRGLTLADIEVFVVVAGPGSFTGLRVGIAAVQGWAFATGRNVVTVPTLDALVASLPKLDALVASLPKRDALVASVPEPSAIDSVIVPCLDGLRGEVFYGAWQNGERLIDAAVGRPDAVVAAIRAVAAGAAVVISGDGAVKYAGDWTAAGWRQVAPGMPLAEAAVGLAAAGRFPAGAPHAARPMYVRRPDAEIVRERGGRRA